MNEIQGENTAAATTAPHNDLSPGREVAAAGEGSGDAFTIFLDVAGLFVMVFIAVYALASGYLWYRGSTEAAML